MARDEEGVLVYICAFLCWPFGLFKWISIKDSKPNAAKNVLIVTVISLILYLSGGWSFNALNRPPF